MLYIGLSYILHTEKCFAIFSNCQNVLPCIWYKSINELIRVKSIMLQSNAWRVDLVKLYIQARVNCMGCNVQAECTRCYKVKRLRLCHDSLVTILVCKSVQRSINAVFIFSLFFYCECCITCLVLWTNKLITHLQFAIFS